MARKLEEIVKLPRQASDTAARFLYSGNRT